MISDTKNEMINIIEDLNNSISSLDAYQRVRLLEFGLGLRDIKEASSDEVILVAKMHVAKMQGYDIPSELNPYKWNLKQNPSTLRTTDVNSTETSKIESNNNLNTSIFKDISVDNTQNTEGVGVSGVSFISNTNQIPEVTIVPSFEGVNASEASPQIQTGSQRIAEESELNPTEAGELAFLLNCCSERRKKHLMSLTPDKLSKAEQVAVFKHWNNVNETGSEQIM